MKKLTKKAEDYAFNHNVAILLLTVIAAIVLAGVFVPMYEEADEIAARDACQKSVMIAPEGLVRIGSDLFDIYGNNVRLECQTEYIEYSTKDEEEIKRIVADKMAECWAMYGEGKKQVFAVEDGAFCAVCSRLSFKEDVTINEFTAYLDNTYMGEQSLVTYWEYLMGITVDEFGESFYDNSELKKYDRFSTASPIAVMFVTDKEAYPDAFLVETTKEEAAIVGGVITGATATVAATVGGIWALAAGVCSGVVLCPYAIIGAGIASVIVYTGAGAAIGYSMGADHDAFWNARIMLWDYDELGSFPCTTLESKSTPLEIKEK